MKNAAPLEGRGAMELLILWVVAETRHGVAGYPSITPRT
jgi:hypothetical protein